MSHLQSDICGDCGAPEPSWASINRGILLCRQCCSIHRSLGRHISQVRAIHQGIWNPSILNFVNTLNAQGANIVWEHSIFDSNVNSGGGKFSKRKPNAKDALHPTKSEFIQAKHLKLAYVLKATSLFDENAQNLEIELSKQLHASVRTNNLETSLRLLVQGADPNFFNEEKGNYPLHVAAKFGQSCQVELLIIYGAKINVVDSNIKTPIDIAEINKHNAIADRLLEALYEVTDRITVFLGGKKPNHKSGNHINIVDQPNLEISDQLKIARGRLQLVPNKMFEELVMDLYDEVDRREAEATWSTTSSNSDIGAVPFLPTNPHLSATRNQGRQKLARLSPSEFSGLLIDVLTDARRRQNMANLLPIDSNAGTKAGFFQHESNHSDDEPLYDAVASDDDYAALAPVGQQVLVNKSPINNASCGEVEALRKQLVEYVYEINQLKTVVQQLSSENLELKSKFSNSPLNCDLYDTPLGVEFKGSEDDGKSTTDNFFSNQQIKRPVSMYETRLAPLNKSSECRATTSMYQMANKTVAEFSQSFTDEVKHRTNLVTRRLKDLCVALQDLKTNKDSFISCAEHISTAVADLIATLATKNCDGTIAEAIKQLHKFTSLIQRECECLQKSLSSEDSTATDMFMQKVRDCAINLASATKILVMHFQ